MCMCTLVVTVRRTTRTIFPRSAILFSAINRDCATTIEVLCRCVRRVSRFYDIFFNVTFPRADNVWPGDKSIGCLSDIIAGRRSARSGRANCIRIKINSHFEHFTRFAPDNPFPGVSMSRVGVWGTRVRVRVFMYRRRVSRRRDRMLHISNLV